MYQLIFHREEPFDGEKTEGRIFRDKVTAHKCAYEYYRDAYEEGCTIFAGPESYETLLTVVEFISVLLDYGQILISREDGSHIYISYAESEPE